jgi:hypothetical protein
VELDVTYATARGVGWIAPTPPRMRRASHALAQDGDVWLVDPVDAVGLDALIAPLGTVRGVLQLLDRHARDCAALARRHGAPHIVTPTRGLPGTPFRTIVVSDRRWWREVALWWPGERTLVVPEALGTGSFFLAAGERIGVHPGMRLFPPRVLDGLDPLRVLVGHGPPLEGEAAAAQVSRAIAGSRRGLPRLLTRLPQAWRAGR